MSLRFVDSFVIVSYSRNVWMLSVAALLLGEKIEMRSIDESFYKTKTWQRVQADYMKHAHYLCERFPHLRDKRSKLWRLEGDGDVCVADSPAVPPYQAHHLVQQDFAVDAFVLGIRVGEKVAYIPKRQRAQEGVAKSVDGHVAVGVGYKALGAFHLHSSQPHWKPFRNGVDVITLTYPVISFKPQ